VNIVPGVSLSVCLKVAGQADRQTGSKTGRHTDIQTYRHTERLVGWGPHRQRERERERERERGQMDIWIVRQREKQTISTYGLTERRIQEETDRDAFKIYMFMYKP
jgi:hypothetical protein